MSEKTLKERVADTLEEYSAFLEIDGQTGRAHAYDKAARAVRMASRLPANPARLDGIGDSTRNAVIEVENTGTLPELEELREEYYWYDEFKNISHIGPSRARTLYENYSIDSKEKLQMMADADDLTLLQGVGPKTATKIKQSLNRNS